jgi:hypothetical protein
VKGQLINKYNNKRSDRMATANVTMRMDEETDVPNQETKAAMKEARKRKENQNRNA